MVGSRSATPRPPRPQGSPREAVLPRQPPSVGRAVGPRFASAASGVKTVRSTAPGVPREARSACWERWPGRAVYAGVAEVIVFAFAGLCGDQTPAGCSGAVGGRLLLAPGLGGLGPLLLGSSLSRVSRLLLVAAGPEQIVTVLASLFAIISGHSGAGALAPNQDI